MRRSLRSLALVSALTLLITGCGLALLGTAALAPDAVALPPQQGASADVALADSRLRQEPARTESGPMARESYSRLRQEPARTESGPKARESYSYERPASVPDAPAAVPEPVVVPKAALPAADVGPMKHVWQSLNNCGPAAVVMALSTLGINESQEVARLALRGTDPRRGMGPAGVGPWVEERFGLRSMWRNNGTTELMRALVSNGFAPMVTQWLVDPGASRVAHWRTVQGYDDARGVFYVNDPMRGAGVALGYEWFDRNWQPFSYRYMVVYRPEDEPLLRAIVGDEWSERTNRERHYTRAKAEALAQGTSAANLAYGQAAYGFGMFAEAVRAFEKGLALGSGEGVFTLRSSYPRALAALGRVEEAEQVQQRLARTARVPSAVAPAPDPLALRLALERAPRFDEPRLSD